MESIRSYAGCSDTGRVNNQFIAGIQFTGTIYNGVRLRGDSSGALEALVKRAGTNGAPALQQIVNPLFTDTVVHMPIFPG